jgi:MraZ protein
MFRGRFEQSLDEKGRVPVPARFRDVLARAGQNTLVLTRSMFEPCIAGFPLDEWQKVEANFARLPQFDPAVQRLRRLLTGDCAEVELDKQGRILIPEDLRAHAKLEKDVMFVGAMQTVEIWGAQGGSQHMADLLKDPALLEKMRSLGV